jgi:hypothetical protein
VRAIVAKAIILIFIFIMTVQPVAALTTISIPFVSTGCTDFIAPLANTACTIEEFNSASTVYNSAEHLSISFPLCNDNSNQEMSAPEISDEALTGEQRTSSALPFGAVDLALPAISQAALDSMASQRTYFFTDTF